VHVVNEYEKAFGTGGGPILIASTAHWAKFPQAVLAALQGKDTPPAGEEHDAVDIQKVFDDVIALAPNAKVPRALQDVAALSLSAARTSPATLDSVVASLMEFASQ
jgi:threonine synthase